MKKRPVLEPEYREIKQYLKSHTKKNACSYFNRSNVTIMIVDRSKDYKEYKEHRNDTKYWCKSVKDLPKPKSWYKKTPAQRFNEEFSYLFDKEEK